MYLQMHAVQCINVFGNKSMLNESLGTDGNLYDPWQHGEPLAEQRPEHEEQRVEDVERADGDEHDEEERVVAVLQGGWRFNSFQDLLGPSYLPGAQFNGD